MDATCEELDLEYIKLLVYKYAKLGNTVEQNYRYIMRNSRVHKDQRKLLRNELKKGDE